MVKLGTFFLFLISLLSFSKVFGEEYIFKPWDFKSIDKRQRIYHHCSCIDSLSIDVLIASYKEDPYEEGYNVLLFSEAIFIDGNCTYLVFDIKYVDGIQVVFELANDKTVIDNFLISEFDVSDQ